MSRPPACARRGCACNIVRARACAGGGGGFGRENSDGDGGSSERPFAADRGAAAPPAAALIGGAPPPGGVVGEWIEQGGVLMFRRTREEREANPERLNLDRSARPPAAAQAGERNARHAMELNARHAMELGHSRL